MCGREQLAMWCNDLECLAQLEYGTSIHEVAKDPDRLRRLAGVMVKQRFGTATPIGDRVSMTGARRYWQWDLEAFDEPDLLQTPEYELLARLCGPTTDQTGALLDLAATTDSERGLFKILAGWLQHQLQGQETSNLRSYYGAEETNRQAAVLDTADLLANFALTPLYLAVLPAGGYVIPILLLAAKHGYAAIFDSPDGPDHP